MVGQTWPRQFKISVSQMSQIDDSGIERRFQRNTYIVIGVSLIAGWFLAGRRMALGVALGGALCLLNIRWLSGSVRAILSKAALFGYRRRHCDRALDRLFSPAGNRNRFRGLRRRSDDRSGLSITLVIQILRGWRKRPGKFIERVDRIYVFTEPSAGARTTGG
jgi:hypothetical protein